MRADAGSDATPTCRLNAAPGVSLVREGRDDTVDTLADKKPVGVDQIVGEEEPERSTGPGGRLRRGRYKPCSGIAAERPIIKR